MFMTKIGSPEFWAEWDASDKDEDYPIKVGDRIYWAGTVEPSKGTVVRVEPQYEDSISVKWDRYDKHGPDNGVRIDERELRSPNGIYYIITGAGSTKE